MSQTTILVIEDYPITRKMIRVALQAEDFTVLEAGTAAEALAIASRRMPNLVLQDLGLPDMDGIELQRRLRSLPGGSDVLILACSGRAAGPGEQRPVPQGFDDYLVKPVEPTRLIDVVRAHLRGLERAPERRLLGICAARLQLQSRRAIVDQAHDGRKRDLGRTAALIVVPVHPVAAPGIGVERGGVRLIRVAMRKRKRFFSMRSRPILGVPVCTSSSLRSTPNAKTSNNSRLRQPSFTP